MNAPTNADLAEYLDRLAGVLADDGAPPDRTYVWYSAANAVRGLARPVADVMRRGGTEAVAELPGIDRGLALIITAMVESAGFDEESLALAS